MASTRKEKGDIIAQNILVEGKPPPETPQADEQFTGGESSDEEDFAG